ncbi:PadR family transcriptional regulator [Streptomyces sp. NPDC058239]|uniref:PadR family transcriptional regulator n=1 Tax=Streptomyces sp. NPDC058239 TaxID=3346395 RepID=UPI0036E1A06A
MTRQNPPLTEPQYFILAALMDGPLHGYGIIKAAEQATDGRLRIAVGTLYGALERMERAGLVAASHEVIVDGRARRYYVDRAAGRSSHDLGRRHVPRPHPLRRRGQGGPGLLRAGRPDNGP